MSEIDPMMEKVVALWGERSNVEGSSEAVYATLREAILSKALRPGPQYAEEDLARVFGVSRTPIREAILRLESEHLMQRRGRRRVSVSEISPAEVLEIYDVRVALDGLAAELAARHATPPEIAQLHWVTERMKSAEDRSDFDTISALSLEWHEWLARASRNSFLLNQIRMVHDRVRRFERTTFEYPGRGDAAIVEHEQILAAVQAGDAARAIELAQAHMLNAKKVRLAMVESGLPDAAEPQPPPG
jgi:DNA-binding GntR family transcriptional regulator